MLFASIAPGAAQTRDDPESRTTVVPYTRPPERYFDPGQNYDSAAGRQVRNPSVGSDGGPGWLFFTLFVAVIFFVIGRYTAPPPPAPGDVLRKVTDEFDEQKRLGKIYNWDKLDPVLEEAKKAVLGTLRKLKLVP